ncbi:4-hydroxybenzoate decarboxylase subunit C,3-octaprenyl-4-hydroxybenzoate decarboxylase,3-polyprenyl-4-hydroxybenzoate decarboxylase and related decarboxylases,menaquinone biosynthesis decarboxylase, SCO4490 family,3-octaprenyl-4-hydroxybenzoate carboxy-lyase [Chlamydia serpentis]|uniref:4-hydroxybenzoate decarboxylase n=1 Tax=Chlamydia serpentis TaxID=1967782 RepID=A0A2R8FAW6_9CHLA|nr:menaquinone biosynthesis decarboxylase [Chlamydia serpentis]SPN73472.1 4-hydroxybenzoate decarboxylase subunit C,3-octaprenyl-4-hydroxybenzoate decarboxylase,3-polyprenyl-4-hydroxybenzoate decarboxylase and related decarboxylases,menaquinone biosynthesis decarboxylase, SCO4490 family,3-octaprenyl-4-hydroxybenzoate carboxy-lyase [Chlamydia serpentis]
MSFLRRHISLFRSQKQLVDIFSPVNPYLELAEIHRRVIENQGPALLFHNVLGSPFPVLTNFFGTKYRVDQLFAQAPDDLIAQVTRLLSSPLSFSSLWKSRNLLKRGLTLGLKKTRLKGFPFISMPKVNLDLLPLLTSWPEDGGAFITLPLVYTESPTLGTPNLGMYRMQRFNQSTLGLHFQIQKGGGMHLYEAEEKQQHLPVTVFLSGNPFLTLSAIAPLPENISELLFATFLQGSKFLYKKIKDHPHPLLYDTEFILIGESPAGKRHPEGPFGDHFGYYSLQHDFPEFRCHKIYHRKDAIYPATVVGKPYQEDFYLGNKLQEYLSPIFPLVMPGVRNLKSYGESGFHALTAAIVKERYWRESLATALRILGEGQLSLTKFLMITDQEVSLEKFTVVLETILERLQPHRDLIIFSETANDTLDYTGPSLNKGSKGIFMGIGTAIRTLPYKYRGGKLPGVQDLAPFCRGCLVLETSMQSLCLKSLLSHPDLKQWPLIILTDNLKKTIQSEKDFLWQTFTRCAPATDLHTLYTHFSNHRPNYTLPLIIDALMKPSYPKEVQVDPFIEQKVSQRWHEYFPNQETCYI